MPPLSTSARDASEDISEEKDGGLRKIIVTKGTGLKPLRGDKVLIRYVGFLENGNHFTSNRNSEDEAFSFTIGKEGVIKAWEVAVLTMQQGEKCVLYCHHSYAYSSSGFPPLLRPHTNCLFELELLLFEGEDISKRKNGEVRKSVMEVGEGSEYPTEGAFCELSYECMLLDGTLVENMSGVEVVLGEVDALTKGVDRALRKMKRGEKARLLVHARQAYGGRGCAALGVAANTNLLYHIQLHHFNNVLQHWEMSRQQLLHEAEEQKNKGGVFFKEGKVYQARKRYSRALLLAQSVNLRGQELTALQQPPSNTQHNINNNSNDKKTDETSNINKPDVSSNINNHADNINNYVENNNINNNSDNNLDNNNSTTKVHTQELAEMLRHKQDLQLKCLLNISACHLRMRKYLRAFDAADQALSLSGNHHNVKALYRRGMAHYHMANHTEAYQDFKAVLSIEPQNVVCARLAAHCHRDVQSKRQQDRQVFKDMFQKFALFDLQKGSEDGTAGRSDVFSHIGEWENQMADGMMTLEQEMEAFGESMPATAGQHSDED